MSNVMVVTDSTAGIPDEYLQEYPIRVLPLHVIWGEETYQDGIDIHPDEFYKRLASDKALPSTSQVTPEEFKKEYSRLIDSGFEILSIHISSELSGTLDSAIQAKKALRGTQIELIDSKSTSMAMGFQVLRVAQMAKNGASLEECKTAAQNAMAQSGVYFAVNTLEFLHRGGRIGGAAAFMGQLLNLKPLLELRDGRIEAAEKVRTLSKALDRMLDLVEEKLKKQNSSIHLCAVHANSPREAEELLSRAVSRFPASLVVDATISTISPVLGTHTGPGVLGIAYMSDI